MLEYAVLGVVIAFFGGVFALYISAVRDGGRVEGESSIKDAIIKKDEELNDKIAAIESRAPDYRAAISKLRERARNRN